MTSHMIKILFLLFTLLSPGSLSFAAVSKTQDQSRDRKLLTLEVNKPVTRELSGTETEDFELQLEASQYANVVVEELSIDVSVSLVDPNGKLTLQVDNPIQALTTESLLFITETSGNYRIIVRPVRAKSPRGRYVVRVEELRTATKDDEKRILAQRTFLDADQLSSKRTAESLQRAAEKYEESRVVFHELLDHEREAGALVGLARASAGLRDKPKAIGYYDRAQSLYRLTKNQKMEAQILYRIGVLLDELNEKKRAVQILEQSVSIARAVNDARQAGTSLYYLGTVYNDLFDRENAIRCLKEAIPLHQTANDGPSEGATTNYLGDVYLSVGDNEQALKYYSQSLELRQKLKDEDGEATSLQNLGLLYLSEGEMQKALDHLTPALTIYRRREDFESQAEVLGLLGLTFNSLGQPKEAVAQLNDGLKLARQHGYDETAAKLLTSLGIVFTTTEEFDKALDCYEQARPLIEKLHDPAAEAARDFSVGLLQYRREEFDKALDSFERAESKARALDEASGADRYAVLSGLTAYMLDDEQKARNKFSSAIPRLQMTGERSFQALARAGLATIERDRGNLNAARSQIEAALALIESQRTSVVSPDLRISFFSSVQNYFELYIEILMLLHKQNPKGGFDIAALEASERARARSLLELLTEAKTDIRKGIDPEILKQERVAEQKLNAMIAARARLLAGQYTPEEATSAAREIEKATADLRAIQTRIKQVSPEYAALTQPQPLALKDMQVLLDPDTVLLQYRLGQDGSFLWFVSKTETAVYELPPRADIEKSARSVYESFTAATDSPNNKTAQSSRVLSQTLLGPVASRLGQKRLVFVADGALQYLPFAALPDPAGGRDSSTPQPLIVNHEIVNLPSISVLATLRSQLPRREAPSRQLAIIADPVFSARDKRLKKNFNTVVTSTPQRWDRLKGTRDEADKLSALLNTDKPLRALDFEATRELATSGVLSKYRHVLFATHTEVNDLHPELSAIVLSLVDEKGNSRDGYLRLNEIYNLRLSADLVVLSGCQTGLGQEVRGEGLIGLTRGFMYAGAPRVMASLWQVNDLETSELIVRFYRSMLKEGRRPAAALRAAQLEMLKSNKWHSPYYWAGFVLQGEWK
jgi:CHAT domain-containing protein/predicted negative regulator of RcsB-dependent stress response